MKVSGFQVVWSGYLGDELVVLGVVVVSEGMTESDSNHNGGGGHSQGLTDGLNEGGVFATELNRALLFDGRGRHVGDSGALAGGFLVRSVLVLAAEVSVTEVEVLLGHELGYEEVLDALEGDDLEAPLDRDEVSIGEDLLSNDSRDIVGDLDALDTVEVADAILIDVAEDPSTEGVDVDDLGIPGERLNSNCFHAGKYTGRCKTCE